MSNEYYSHTTYPSNNAPLSSAGMRAELDNVEAGLDKLPTLAGNNNKLVAVDATGSALVSVTAATAKTALALNNVDNTSDAAKNAAAATLTNKTIDGNTNTLLNPTLGENLTAVTGTNTITASADAGITGYITGQSFRFIAASANTGAVTININGLGAKNVYKSGTLPLELGDIAVGQSVSLVYDGTQFQFSSGAGGGGGAKAGGVIYENSTTIATSYTLTASKNGLSVGPITVADGAALTVGAGQRYVVL